MAQQMSNEGLVRQRFGMTNDWHDKGPLRGGSGASKVHYDTCPYNEGLGLQRCGATKVWYVKGQVQQVQGSGMTKVRYNKCPVQQRSGTSKVCYKDGLA